MKSKHANDTNFYRVDLTAETPAKTIHIPPHEDIVLSLLSSPNDTMSKKDTISKLSRIGAGPMPSRVFRYGITPYLNIDSLIISFLFSDNESSFVFAK